VAGIGLNITARAGKVFAHGPMPMSHVSGPEVFTLDEVARAVGVPRSAVESLVHSGALRPLRGTGYYSERDAVAQAGRLRSAAVLGLPSTVERALLFSAARGPVHERNRLPVIASSCVHGLLLVIALCLTADAPQSAPAAVQEEPTRLVFLMSPGPGGGGGGSGARAQRPAPRLERRGPDRSALSVPKVAAAPASPSAADDPEPAPSPVTQEPQDRAPEPLASHTVIAPVVVTRSSDREQEGVVERPAENTASQGPGVGGDAGSGRGAGSGDGLGDGIGNGAGGGTGGGPYRPGSGIDPPRLLREVKADYTEDARRKGISGNVVLEIVVRRDGSVGQVTIRRSLTAGLDERAIAAVRQWQFAPARRLGQAVDVMVEVVVEFTLR
jgi:protein TonB